MTAIIATATIIAKSAHAGQLDNVGHEYIEHPVFVANMLSVYGERAYAAGILHDVIEDSEYTAETLTEFGIPSSVVKAVVKVSKPNGVKVDYQKYIADMCSTIWEDEDMLSPKELKAAGLDETARVPLAVLVKLADNFHNASDMRAQGRKPGNLEKYLTARATMQLHVPQEVISRFDDFVG